MVCQIGSLGRTNVKVELTAFACDDMEQAHEVTMGDCSIDHEDCYVMCTLVSSMRECLRSISSCLSAI